MRLPKAELTELLLICALLYLVGSPSWVAASALLAVVLLHLGCRLIAYRQAEDVSALAKRFDAIEQEAKRVARLAENASAQSRAKAQGF